MTGYPDVMPRNRLRRRGPEVGLREITGLKYPLQAGHDNPAYRELSPLFGQGKPLGAKGNRRWHRRSGRLLIHREWLEKCYDRGPILGGAFGIAVLTKCRGPMDTRDPRNEQDSALLVRAGVENGPR